jgi:predicted metal-dependent hydrolase
MPTRAQVAAPWPYGPELLYRGESHRVEVQAGSPGRVDRVPEPALLVQTPSAGTAGARQVLQRWLKQEAEVALRQQVAALGTRMGLQAKRIYVRNLRSKWGACWPGGSLSFNYRLVMAPPAVLDYVVVHELAHLRQPNHSPDFWAIVGEHCAGYRDARRWLRVYGPSLAI